MLSLQTQLIDDVMVIRCHGRIVFGPEVEALQLELDKQAALRKKIVLQLAETDYIDSSGLGALVRNFGRLRSAGGDLKLSNLSPFVQQVLEVTGLLNALSTYPSEEEAIEAFYKWRRTPQEEMRSSATKILCVDTSRDLLAYLSALLKRSGHEVQTSQYLAEAATLASVMRPHLVICGPGVMGLPTGEEAVEKFRRTVPKVQILHLRADFSTTNAGEAGTDLLDRVRALLA